MSRNQLRGDIYRLSDNTTNHLSIEDYLPEDLDNVPEEIRERSERILNNKKKT
ncbi:MAG: hypothetical protein LBC61_03725 [Candidatus Peribacteria bacterium]|jgi:hypothetical protein|nr:hypothetical protein [Candidatus Peribacteria bacterium]